MVSAVGIRLSQISWHLNVMWMKACNFDVAFAVPVAVMGYSPWFMFQPSWHKADQSLVPYQCKCAWSCTLELDLVRAVVMSELFVGFWWDCNSRLLLPQIRSYLSASGIVLLPCISIEVWCGIVLQCYCRMSDQFSSSTNAVLLQERVVVLVFQYCIGEHEYCTYWVWVSLFSQRSPQGCMILKVSALLLVLVEFVS